MWRYYALATLIVLLAGSALFAQRLAVQGWKLHAETRGTPSRAQGNANAGFVTTPQPFFSGQGGWVLSALPGCFDQQSSIEGPSQALVLHVPPARDRVPAGTTLHAGDCTVLVRSDDIWVSRGKDRVRVPPRASLYRVSDGLTLVYEHDGNTDVRVYRVAPAR